MRNIKSLNDLEIYNDGLSVRTSDAKSELLLARPRNLKKRTKWYYNLSPTYFLGIRTPSRQKIIAAKGPLYFQDGTDMQPQPNLQNKRIEAMQLQQNGIVFQMPIATGLMNFLRTGPKPSSSEDVTFLVLPGCPDQNFTNFPLIRKLAERHDVVALEVPGRAWSTDENRFKEPYTMDSSAYAIKAAIKQLELKNIVVVAHSFAQAEAVHTIAIEGPKELNITGLVSLNGWNPQIIPERMPFDFNAILISSPLTARYAWMITRLLPDLTAGMTWKKMVDKRQAGVEISQATRQWTRVFKEKGGYSKQKAFNTSRREKVVGDCIHRYQMNISPFLGNLRDFPILFIGSDRDRTVRGPRDKSGAAYAQRCFEQLLRIGNTNSLTKVVNPPGEHCFQFKYPESASEPILDWVSQIQKRGQDRQANINSPALRG